MRTLLLTLTIIFSINATATVVHRDLVPDSTLTYTLEITETFLEGYGIPLDIDEDGTADYNFRFQVTSSIGGISWTTQMHPMDQANQVLWKNATLYWDHHYVADLSKGDTIGPSSLFGKDTLPMLGNNLVNHFSGIGDTYIGVKFMRNGAYHYGWILVEFEFKGQTGNLTVKEIAYQDVPGETLYAGLKVTGLPPDTWDPKLTIFPNPSKDMIHIHGGTSAINNVELTNTLGKTVLRMNADGKEEILLDVSHLEKGIYYVILTSELNRKTQPVIIE